MASGWWRSPVLVLALLVACAHAPDRPTAYWVEGAGPLDEARPPANEPRPWCGEGTHDHRADSVALAWVFDVWQAGDADRALDSELHERQAQPRSSDGRDRKRQDAELGLGRALACMGLPSVALAVFDHIAAEGSGNPHYLSAATWLVRLSHELPAGSRVSEAIGRYQRADLDAPELLDVKPEAALLLARRRYEQGRYDDTLALLALIPPTSPSHARAKLLEGATHVRNYSAAPAATAFRDAARVSNDARGPERRRLHELALISLARLFFSTGQFAIAAGYYDLIPTDSPLRPDSLFEGAWTRFMAEDLAHALASLTLLEQVDARRPVKPESAAEALVLKAAIHEEQDLAEPAAAELEFATSMLSSLFMEVKKLREDHDTDAAMLKLARELRRGAAGGDVLLSPIAARYVRGALLDPEVGKSFGRLSELDDELRRCHDAGESWTTSGAGRYSVATLSESREAAARATSNVARRRLRRLDDEIGQILKHTIGTGYEPLAAPSARLELDVAGRGFTLDHIGKVD